MVQRAEALVVEDNPWELGEMSDLITGCGLVPYDTTSPRQAIRWLSARQRVSPSSGAAGSRHVATQKPSVGPLLHSPILAVVDWNMELSPDYVATADSVLIKLRSLHPDTLVIVYGAGVGGDLDLQEAIARAHPAAIPHDKRQGAASLRERISKLLAVSCGDIQIDRGSALHVPSGARHGHAIAMKLLLAYPRAIYLEPNSSAYRASRRFGVWLEQVGSTVALASPGARSSFYQLEVSE